MSISSQGHWPEGATPPKPCYTQHKKSTTSLTGHFLPSSTSSADYYQLFLLKLVPKESNLTACRTRHLFVYISQWGCWHPHTAHNDCVQALTKKCTLLKVQTLQQNFSFVPHSFPDTLTKPYLRETAKKKQWLCDLESENRTAPIGASLVTKKSFNKTERCILDVKGLNQSVAFLSKKAVEFSAVLLFFCLPLPKRLNCWLIFVSQLDSLPLALHLLPLILTRLLTPKSEDPSSLASGNELVRWAVRFIAHEAGVSLCECVSVYRECLSVCVPVCVCWEGGNAAFSGFWIYCVSAWAVHVHIHVREGAKCWIYTSMCSCVCACVYKIIHLWQCHKLCHISWRYHLLGQVYVLFSFHYTWSYVAGWLRARCPKI